MRVFLSYRHDDTGGYAGRLHDALVERLGANNVFQDVAAIGPGVDFTEAIDSALDQSDAVLGMIGPTWITASTADGEARLLQDDDFVRLELARALTRAVPVVPVLVGGARLPMASELPEDLRPLAHRQAVELRDERWLADVDNLLRSLEGEPDPRRATGRTRAFAAGAALAVATIVVVASWFGLSRDGGGGETLPPCESSGGADWNDLAIVAAPTPIGRNDDAELVFRVQGGHGVNSSPGTGG